MGIFGRILNEERCSFSVQEIPEGLDSGNFFLNGTFGIRKLARRILKQSGASDSPVNFMCNNMGFLTNLLSSDFDGHFFIFGLYFRLLSTDKIDVLRPSLGLPGRGLSGQQ